MNALRDRIADARERLLRLTDGLTRLCEFLLVYWPLYLALCLVAAALCFLPVALPVVGVTFTPGWWWTLLAGLTLLPVLLGAVYMLHPLPPSPGWRFSRQPLSSLGEAEVVMIDTSLLTDGQQETLVALPLDPTPDLRKRPEAMPLALAMAYTASLQNEETAAVLTHTAAALGVQMDNLLRLKPIVGKTQLGALPGVIVEDGKRKISYFVGDPVALSGLCAGIDPLCPRPMGPEDQARIRGVAQAMRQQGALALGFAMMDVASDMEGPVYLGLISMRDVVSEDAAMALQALREAGYSLQTQPIDEGFEPPMRLAALRQRLRLTDALYAPQVILSTGMLDTHALCIAAADHRHRRFDGPILLAREWFGQVAAWLRLTLGVALPLILACALGAANPLCCLAVSALLAAGLTSAASDDRRWDLAGLLLLGGAAALRLFLLFVPAVSAGGAMGLFAIMAAWVVSLHLSRRARSTLVCVAAGIIFMALGWALPGLSLLGGLLALLAGVLAGLGAGQLLRLS